MSDWTPPFEVVHELNARILPQLEREDARLTSVGAMLARARAAKEQGQFDRAENLIRKSLSREKDNPAALAMLCSLLRTRTRPEQALRETERFRRKGDAPLLTCRAAALCDLERWEEAKREIARVLAKSGKANPEAFNVVRRIKSVRPDLYMK